MIKYYCDRCGADMSRERVLGYISLNTKDKAEKELREDNEFEKWHFCKNCMYDIRRYVRTLPLKTSQNEEKRLKTKKNVIKMRKSVIKTRKSVANLLKAV